MKQRLIVTAGLITLLVSSATLAGAREEQLRRYGTVAKVTSFSAVRGQALHRQSFTGGRPDTPSCTTCHGKEISSAGSTLSGKAIEPMAVSASPGRYTDPAKIEKWFKRNCIEVLGRECTPQEKGDWLAFVMSQ